MHNIDKRLQLLLEQWQVAAQDARETAQEVTHTPTIFGHAYGVSDGLSIAIADLQNLLEELKEVPESSTSQTSGTT